jgi:hypothetical protein
VYLGPYVSATMPGLLIEVGVLQSFYLGWPTIKILLISVSVAEITGMSHHAWYGIYLY